MDAREYMAKKGIDQGRDEARPNTLEEKAWARAREAADHRPRAGTPHDWEEWERYHDELAEGAEELDQKFDHDAHEDVHAPEQPSRGDKPGQDQAPRSDAVQQFDPVSAETSRQAPPAIPDEPAPRAALLALAVLMPPLAVGLAQAGRRNVGVNLLLTLLGWVPGVIHALKTVKPR